MNLNIKPGDLQNDEYIKDKLTTPELRNFIKMEELRGSEGLNTLRVELYRRTRNTVHCILVNLNWCSGLKPENERWQWFASCHWNHHCSDLYSL